VLRPVGGGKFWVRPRTTLREETPMRCGWTRRRDFLLGILATLIALALLAASPAGRQSEVGRYQLFQGRFYHYSSTAPDRPVDRRDEHIGVFLLDTASGNSWTLFQSNYIGPRWTEIEPPGEPDEESPSP
jgi:hypothetical protein